MQSYGFEHAGRSQGFSHIAYDAIRDLKKRGVDIGARCTETKVWEWFSLKQSGKNLNPRNNPMAPKATEYKTNPGKIKETVHKTIYDSAIKIAGEMESGIISHAKNELKNENIKGIFESLIEINGVGPKISSFFLRDVAIKFQIQCEEDRHLLQPIDIWIERMADTCLGTGKQAPSVAKGIVEKSSAYAVNPELVNAGAWYLGSVIVGSEYRFRQVLSSPAAIVSAIREHEDNVTATANALSGMLN